MVKIFLVVEKPHDFIITCYYAISICYHVITVQQSKVQLKHVPRALRA